MRYNQSEDSPLRHYFSTRVACVLLEVIRVTPSACLVFGARSGIWEAMCLPFAILSHITSLYTCTPAHLSKVCTRYSQSFHRHDRGTPTTRFLPSHPDRPNFLSQFYFPISHRHPCLKVDRWGVLKVKKGKKRKRRRCRCRIS